MAVYAQNYSATVLCVNLTHSIPSWFFHTNTQEHISSPPIGPLIGFIIILYLHFLPGRIAFNFAVASNSFTHSTD